jgi:hypothetical protein
MSLELEFTRTGSLTLCAFDQAMTRILKEDRWQV